MRRVQFLLLLAFTFLLPFERLWEVTLHRDSVLKPYRLVGFAFLLVGSVGLLLKTKRPRLDFGDKSYFVIFTWGIATAFVWSMLEVIDLEHTTHGAQLILFGVAMYTLAKQPLLRSEDVDRVLTAYVCGVAASVAIGVWYEGAPSGRLAGLQTNPNQMGTSAALCLLVIVGRLLYSTKVGAIGWFVQLVPAVAAVALLGLSGSRTALAAATVGLLVILVLAFRRAPSQISRRRRVRALGLAAVAAAVLLGASDRISAAWEDDPASARVRFTEEYTVKTAGERWDIWRSGVNVGLQHYGLGAGMQQYTSHHIESIRSLGGVSNPRMATVALGTHSDYINLFANYGLIGLGIYALYVRGLVRSLLGSRTADTEGAHLPPLVLGLLGALLVAQVTMNCFAWCDYYITMALVHVVASGSIADGRRTSRVVATQGRAGATRARPHLGSPGLAQ